MAVHDPRLQGFLDEVQNLCSDWLSNTTGDQTKMRKLVVVGPVGIGKSRTLRNVVAWASAVDRLPAPRPALIRFDRFCENMRVQDIEYADAIRNWQIDGFRHVGMLCVDDIGTETDQFKSGTPTRTLSSLLEDSLETCCAIFSTNIPVPEWASRWDERVADRLWRNSTIINLQGVKPWSEVT